MHHNHKLSKLQESRLQKHAQQSTPHTFFNILTSPELFSVVEDALPEHRERKFPPTETLSMFLAQMMNADRSCQNVVNEMALTRALHGMPMQSSNTGSYCKARKRLPATMVKGLVTHTGQQMADSTPSSWSWKGRPIRLVDGTTLELPDTPENQNAYPQNKHHTGCPLARVVGLICLGSGAILNASMGPVSGKGTSEQTLLRNILDTLKAGDILLGDAFYSTYFLLAELMERNIDAVFEQYGARKRVVNFNKGSRLGKKDHLISYTKPAKPEWMTQEKYDAVPDSLTVRELEANHKVLVTTITSPEEATKNDIKMLYQNRWHIELDLRNIKTTLGMNKLSCHSPDMAEKEMWVYLLAHNLLRIVMAEAAMLSDVLPRELSFKHSLQLWRVWRQRTASIHDDNDLNLLLLLIIEKTVGNRPGRVEPRAVKRWIKTYPVLSRPREEVREAIRKNGHPAKHK